MKIAWLCHYPVGRFRDRIPWVGRDSDIHPGTWIHYLSRELGKDPRLDLHLVTVTPHTARDVRIEEDHVTHHILTLGPKRASDKVRQFLFKCDAYSGFRYSNAKAVRVVENLKPDIVNAHGTEQYGVALNSLGFPRLLSMQGIMNDVYQNDHHFFYNVLKRNEIRVFRKQANFATVPGNMDKVISRYNPRARFFHLWYPVSEEAFRLKASAADIDADVVFVGALIQRKGIDDLLEALAILKAGRPEIRAKLIGPASPTQFASLEGKIEKLGIRKNVRIVGFLREHNNVLAEIKKSRIFVLPTHVDSGPRSVSEAQAMGVPVVSYNIDGLPHMIQSGRTGLLVERNDIFRLAETILGLLKDAEQRRFLSENAYQFALENFSPRGTAKKYLQAYQDVRGNPL